MAFGLAPGIGVVGGTAAPCRTTPAAFGGTTKAGTGGRVKLAEDGDGPEDEDGSSTINGSSAHRLFLTLCSLSHCGFSTAQRFALGTSESPKPLGVATVAEGSPTGTGSARSLRVGHISSMSTSLSVSMKFGADALEDKTFR